MAGGIGTKRNGKNFSLSASAEPLIDKSKVSIDVPIMMAVAEGLSEVDISALLSGLQIVLHRKIATRS